MIFRPNILRDLKLSKQYISVNISADKLIPLADPMRHQKNYYILLIDNHYKENRQN